MRHDNKQFIDDSSAAIGMILALAALPTFSAMALAIDHGQAATTYGEIAVLADEACSRVSTPIIRNEPIATQVAAAQTLLDRRIADFGAAGLTATATDVSGDIHIAISGDLASIMPGQFGDFAVDQILNCSTGAAANANPVATIIFTESFEKSAERSRLELAGPAKFAQLDDIGWPRRGNSSSRPSPNGSEYISRSISNPTRR